jgi:uncharacterized protein (DUF433 family)
MDYLAFFVRDPNICGGELTVKGTRVTVRTVLASLGEGASEQEILADFPTLTSMAIRAVVADEKRLRSAAGGVLDCLEE